MSREKDNGTCKGVARIHSETNRRAKFLDLQNQVKSIVLTVSRESARHKVAVVHIDRARVSSAVANFALTYQRFNHSLK